jgi:hypothetical protein
VFLGASYAFNQIGLLLIKKKKNLSHCALNMMTVCDCGRSIYVDYFWLGSHLNALIISSGFLFRASLLGCTSKIFLWCAGC